MFITTAAPSLMLWASVSLLTVAALTTDRSHHPQSITDSTTAAITGSSIGGAPTDADPCARVETVVAWYGVGSASCDTPSKPVPSGAGHVAVP